MTKTRLGLMGFGRIGRNVFRLLAGRKDLDVVAISDIAQPEALAYLLKYDSIYGRFPDDLEYRDGRLRCGPDNVAFHHGREPGDAPWAETGVDIAIDTTSRYLSSADLKGHLDAGAAKVILTSSPTDPTDVPIVLKGVNDEQLDADPPIVALGSNTSNAAAPVLKTLAHGFGLEHAYLTTVKAMTNTGRLADVPADSYRTSRAAGENIIPTDTNSADIIAAVLPELEGRLTATSLSVPVPDGSNVDMVARLERETSSSKVNRAMRAAAANEYAGVISYIDDPIVSSDVRLDPHSGVFDSLATMVTGGTLAKTITWFNNGWGYSNRVVEVAAQLGTAAGGAGS